MDPWFEPLVLLPFYRLFSILIFLSVALVRVYRQGYRLFKGLEEDQWYTDQCKDADEQVHSVIGNQHRLSGYDPFHRPIGHLLRLAQGKTLIHKTLRGRIHPVVESGIVLVKVLQQDIPVCIGPDMNNSGHDGYSE